MSVEQLVEKIYAFEGNIEEWLVFENDVRAEIAKYSARDLEYL